MTPLIYVLMCLAGGPGSLDLTADERFWRDEQSCVIVRDKLLKECACVAFVPGANAGATVTVPTHDATPVVPRDKIEHKHDEAKREKNDEAKKERHRQNDEAKKEKHRQNDEAEKEKNDEAKKEKHRQNDEAKKGKHRRHREQQVPVEAHRYQEDRGFQRHREQQVPVEAQRYQENRGFDGLGWSNRQY
jgi:hypothetical protein